MNTELLLSMFLIIATFATLKIISFFLNKVGKFKNINDKRIYYVDKTFSFLVYVIALFLLALIWSVNLGAILIFASSIFAVIGVALFAQWSILSNVTSSIIIFFTFASRVGDQIKVIDGDNSVEGEIVEISLFQIEIRDEEGNTVFYPNNLFMQKPIKKMSSSSKTLPLSSHSV